ncbi:MAG: Rad52/Rad22 family DNA repair protein, partial [Ktedonobacterales bacterium]
RLDAVVGAGNWSFDWTPLVIEKGEVMIAKGTLTVYGISKADAGSASNFEQTLGAVSHSFKRAAVHWGIGRYLYNLSTAWVSVEKNGRIPEATLHELRAKLPRPKTAPTVVRGDEGERVVDSPVERERRASSARERQASVIRETSVAREVREPAAQAPAPGRSNPAAQANEMGRGGDEEPKATEAQRASIRKLCTVLGKSEPDEVTTQAQARELISQLSREYQEQQRARRAS